MSRELDTSQDWVGCLKRIQEIIHPESTAIIKGEDRCLTIVNWTEHIEWGTPNVRGTHIQFGAQKKPRKRFKQRQERYRKNDRGRKLPSALLHVKCVYFNCHDWKLDGRVCHYRYQGRVAYR